MPNAVKWETPVLETSLLTTELNSLAGNGTLSTLGSAHDNQTNKDRWASFELAATWGTAPTAGGTVDLYLVPRIDLTNFVDATTTLPLDLLVCHFTPRAVTSAQRLAGRGFVDGGNIILIPPFQFKAIVINNTDQSLAASGNTVKMTTYNEEIQ